MVWFLQGRLEFYFLLIASYRDAGDFDSTQLMALKDFVPTEEERGALQNYSQGLKGSKEEVGKALAALPACEKYMLAMMEVTNAPAKFDCMLFKVQFQSLLDELVGGINILRKSCDEVRHSERLRKMMAMILTLVNQINTGGDGNLALGFNLEALLKLSEAKAFDKKTSVLHYLAKLVRQNDESLLDFKEDLKTVPIAESVILDGLVGDMKMVNEQLKKVSATATSEADALEREGKLPVMPKESPGLKPVEATEGTSKEDTDKGDPDKDSMEIEDSDGEKDDQEGSPEESKSLSNTTESRINDHTEESKDDNVDKSDGEEVPKLRTPMEVFIHKATRDVDKAFKSLDELKKSYSGVLKYFGEDDNMPSNEFFGTLQKFINEFKSASEHVEKIETIKVRASYTVSHQKLSFD